jgi:hypothetical protein
MAVLHKSSAWTGMWWKPRKRSTTEKIILPCLEILYVWQGIAVVYGDVVEAPEVAAGPPATAELWGDVKMQSPGRVGPADDAKTLHLCKLCLCDGQLLTVEACVQQRARHGDVMLGGVLDLVVRAEPRDEQLRELVEDGLVAGTHLVEAANGGRTNRPCRDGGQVVEAQEAQTSEVDGQAIGDEEVCAEDGLCHLREPELLDERAVVGKEKGDVPLTVGFDDRAIPRNEVGCAWAAPVCIGNREH